MHKGLEPGETAANYESVCYYSCCRGEGRGISCLIYQNSLADFGCLKGTICSQASGSEMSWVYLKSWDDIFLKIAGHLMDWQLVQHSEASRERKKSNLNDDYDLN